MTGGVTRNPSFTDYLIPTILDMPPVRLDVLELADPHAPYGLRGVGEAPTISSTPAVVAAIRAATGLELARVPVRPEHIAGQGRGGLPRGIRHGRSRGDGSPRERGDPGRLRGSSPRGNTAGT